MEIIQETIPFYISLKRFAGELRSLVHVEDFRRTLLQSAVQCRRAARRPR